MRIAILVLVAGSAIALSGPIALGQINDRWTGSATCVVIGHSPSHSDYTNQEIHKWEISPIPYAFDDTSGLRVWYWAKWTVTGSGSFGHFSWTTNGGYAFDVLQIWVPSDNAPGVGSTLNIALLEQVTGDNSGTTVTDETDGKVSKVWVYELPIFPTIVALPGQIGSVQDSSYTTINGSIFSKDEKDIKEPDDGINKVTCWWDFKQKPILWKMLPINVCQPGMPGCKRLPGKLCLPDNPDCNKPFVLKPPVENPK
jgi:hypothetical protein